MGATDVPTQASILGLYDPDRLQTINYIGECPSLHLVPLCFPACPREAASRSTARAFGILTETVTSPTLGAQIQDVLKLYPGAKWIQWEPTGHGRRMGSQLAFGQFLNPIYKFDQADVVLSIDSNFLGNGPGGVRYARDFAAKRVRPRRQQNPSRFYAVETTPTSTGCQGRSPAGDQAFRSRPVVRGLAAAAPVAPRALRLEILVQALAKDLAGSERQVDRHCRRRPVSRSSRDVHYINQVLENNGKTVVFTASLEQKPTDQWAELQALVQRSQLRQVDLLLILGGNPVLHARRPSSICAALSRWRRFASVLAMYEDETSEVCQWMHPGSAYVRALERCPGL